MSIKETPFEAITPLWPASRVALPLRSNAGAVATDIQATLDAIGTCLLGLDRLGRITFVNPSACRVLGYHAEELIGREMRGLIYHGQVCAYDFGIAAIGGGLAPAAEEVEFQHQDGHSIAVAYSTQGICEDGHIRGHVLSFLPREELRHSWNQQQDLEAQQASEELIRGIMEAVGHRIAVLDRNGFIIRTNRAWSRFATENGASAATIAGVGLNYFHICAAADDDPFAQASLHAMKVVLSGELDEFNLEYPCHSPTQQRWFLLQITPLRQDIQGLVATHVDITLNKLAEQAVAAAERQLRTMLDSLPGLVGYVDKNLRYQFNNRVYEEWFGQSAHETKGKTMAQVLGQAYVDQARPWLNQALAGERVCFETRIFDHRGNQHALRITYLPDLDIQSEVRGLFILGLDITEQKQTQAALRTLSADMQALMGHQVATQTAAILAHEINQPLSAAATFCEAALRLFQNEPLVSDKTVGVVRRATEEIQRAGNVVRRLLRTLQGGDPLIDTLNLTEIIQEATELFRAETPDPEIRIDMQFTAEALAVRANRLQVEKVLINLLRNARDAMAATTAPSIQIQALRQGDKATVSVIDNGPGLPPAVSKRLFEAFFTTKPHGIGMGLSVSQAIIERLGGELWHEALPAGTAFHFSLPIAQ